MKIAPYRHFKGFWMLGLNPVVIDGSTRFCDRWERRTVFDGFWSGEKWVRRVGSAIHFESETAAWCYLDSHHELMEAIKAKETISAQMDRISAR